eukprot:GILJ01009854.1.p1 GENE.GILJ01009854.1~~GILJ01009854.1.p1  ORF type:complete len:567 (+),score=105.01 GILJ01009854.1:1-1701(+)
MPNRRRPNWTPPAGESVPPPPTKDEEELSPVDTTPIPEAPFPTKLVLKIIATQILAIAPPIMFGAITPYIYGFLVGDLQTAGTVSSVATGISMILQMLFTPIAAQIMDLYGRKKLAIFTTAKSLVLIIPLLIAGIIINSGKVPDGADATDAKIGAYLDGSNKRFVQFLFGAYWLLSLFSSATSTSQSIVAIGDVCQTQKARVAGIGMYAGFANLLAAFAVTGAQLSLMLCSIIALVVAAISVAFSLFLMPETINITGSSEAQQPMKETVAVAIPEGTSMSNRALSSAERRSFYPSQRRARGGEEASSLVAPNSSTPSYTINSSSLQAPQSAPEYNTNRRIAVCANPFAGFTLLKKSRSSHIALWVLFSFLMAEISASDTLVYYLSLKLDFGPSDISYIQIESAVLAVFFCGIAGPFVARYVSCAHLSMMCSVAVVAALLVLAMANTKILIYAAFVPCISITSIQTPSLAAIITKNAITPEDVSLSMSTVMAVVAVLQAGASFLAALVFRALPQDKLYITFIISATFAIPMFFLSIYLGHVIKKEKEEESASDKLAAEEKGIAPLLH